MIKLNRIYERINVEDINNRFGDFELEDEEDPNDVIFDDKILDEIKGGYAYFVSLIFSFVNKENGEIQKFSLPKILNAVNNYSYHNNIERTQLRNIYYSGYDYYSKRNNMVLYDIDIDIRRLTVEKIDNKNIIFSKTKNAGGYLYTPKISKKVLLKDGILKELYLRSNGVAIVFNERKLKDSLKMLVKQQKYFFNNIKSRIVTKEQIESEVKYKKIALEKNKKVVKEIEFLEENKDKLGLYLSKTKITRDLNRYKKSIIDINKRLKEIEEINFNDNPIENLKKKINSL